MPRSGTSLVEQIIDSHPQAFGAGELGTMGNISARVQAQLRTIIPYPDCIKYAKPQPLNSLGQIYLDYINGLTTTINPIRITDKMPGNFQHLGLISLLFPNARIIHTRRNPLDTCLSIYFQNFAGYHGYSYDLGNLGFYYREYERLMAHWHQVVDIPILDVQYEELIDDQEAITRQIIEFCGLEWDDASLRFHENTRLVNTASNQQVRQPLYRGSVARYKRYDAHLGPLKEALGLTEDV
jgi:hypothetical protein